MNLGKSIQNPQRFSISIISGLVAVRNIFRNTTKHNKSRAYRMSRSAGFEALENRKVFANTPYLFLETEETALLESPVDYRSHQELYLAKPAQRSGFVEVRIFGIEIMVERTPRPPTPPTSHLGTSKTQFYNHGLVGEGESPPLHPNIEPNANLTSQIQLTSPRFQLSPSLSSDNSSQQTNVPTNRIELVQLGTQSEFSTAQRLGLFYEDASQPDHRTLSPSDTKQISLDSIVQKNRVDATIADPYLIAPTQTRPSFPFQLKDSSLNEDNDAKTFFVDTALAGDLDFFERDRIGTLLQSGSTQKSIGIVRLQADSQDESKLVGKVNTVLTPVQDWPELPAGMVYLPLGTRTPANSAEGNSRQLNQPRESSELGLLQWFSTYDEQDTIPKEWETRPEIEVVEEMTASHSGSNSDLMFILLISGVLGSSRGFLIAQKEKSVDQVSQGKDGGRTRGDNRLKTSRN